MVSKFVFLVLLAGCLAAPERSKRSLNGRKAIHKEILSNGTTKEHPYGIEYPYMIELLTTGGHLCGGALIKLNFALSAKHCLPKNISDFTDVSRYKLIAGNQIYEDRDSPFVQVRTVESIAVHPWSEQIDLAILKVKEPFKVTIHVNFVKMPTNEKLESFIGKNIIGLGWGHTEKKRHSEHLLKIYGTIIATPGQKFKVKGLYGSYPQGGDSGGPVVIQGENRKDDMLVGVIHATIPKPNWYAQRLYGLDYWISKKVSEM